MALQSKIILMNLKTSEQYINNPVALQLRAMNLIGEGLVVN